MFESAADRNSGSVEEHPEEVNCGRPAVFVVRPSGQVGAAAIVPHTREISAEEWASGSGLKSKVPAPSGAFRALGQQSGAA